MMRRWLRLELVGIGFSCFFDKFLFDFCYFFTYNVVLFLLCSEMLIFILQKSDFLSQPNQFLIFLRTLMTTNQRFTQTNFSILHIDNPYIFGVLEGVDLLEIYAGCTLIKIIRCIEQCPPNMQNLSIMLCAFLSRYKFP